MVNRFPKNIMKKFIFCLIFFNSSVFSNSCGSPFNGWKPPPRWNIIVDEIKKAGKTNYFQPVQVRKRCLSCDFAGYDKQKGYIWIRYDSSMLIPEAERQFRYAVREWISYGIEYHNDENDLNNVP